MIIFLDSLCQFRNVVHLIENAVYDYKLSATVAYTDCHGPIKYYYRNLKRLSIINKSFNGHEIMKSTNQWIII
jgi:hypothetical protein